MSKYEELTAKVQQFASARVDYWSDLGQVLEQFVPRYREYLGLEDSAWVGASGKNYPYFSIGRDQGGNYVDSHIFELNMNENCQYEFLLRGNLQVGNSTHAFEVIYLQMTIERKALDYVFGITGSRDCADVSLTLTEFQCRKGDWSKLFDDVTARIEREFELRQFA